MAKTDKIIAPDTSQVSSSPSYLEWGPVWAGTVIAIAISTILLQFGSAAGLAFGDAVRPDESVSYNFIVAALWLLLVAVVSSSAAGYVAGRMRMTMNDAVAEEVEFRDGIHGVSAWALSTVIVAFTTTLMASISALGVVPEVANAATQVSAEVETIIANQTMIVAFATAAGSALGAAAAWFASVKGGMHRNDGTSVSVAVPSMFRK